MHPHTHIFTWHTQTTYTLLPLCCYWIWIHNRLVTARKSFFLLPKRGYAVPRLRATPAVINCWSINKFLQQQRNTMTQMNTEKPDFFFRCASFTRHQQKEQHDFVIFFSLLLLYAAGNRRSERSAAGKINRCVQCSFMFLLHIMHTTKPTPKMEKNRANFFCDGMKAGSVKMHHIHLTPNNRIFLFFLPFFVSVINLGIINNGFGLNF